MLEHFSLRTRCTQLAVRARVAYVRLWVFLKAGWSAVQRGVSSIFNWLRTQFHWNFTGAAVGVLGGIVGQVLMQAEHFLASEICFGVSGVILFVWAFSIERSLAVRAALAISIIGGTYYIVRIVSDSARRQMDAAHEMAHAVLHRNVSEDGLRKDLKAIESQAFRLASAFLLPSTTYPHEVRHPSLATLLSLKERWRVSIKAQIKRLVDLDIIPPEHATDVPIGNQIRTY